MEIIIDKIKDASLFELGAFIAFSAIGVLLFIYALSLIFVPLFLTYLERRIGKEQNNND